ncbi:MAG: hypothetical protein ACMXYE_00640 [Candidatus Woesearchaeota archaeon]
MAHYEELRDKAGQHLKRAEQMLRFTYPMIKEPKALIGVIHQLFLAGSNAIHAFLSFELTYKKIPPFENTFESKMRIMKQKIIERYSLDSDILKTMRTLREIIIAHQESPVEFSRGEKFIICSDTYSIKDISEPYVQNLFSKTKVFIDELISVMNTQIEAQKKKRF